MLMVMYAVGPTVRYVRRFCDGGLMIDDMLCDDASRSSSFDLTFLFPTKKKKK